MKRIISGIILALLLIGMLTFSIKIQSAKALNETTNFNLSGSKYNKFTNDTAVVSDADDTWPMFGHDLQNTRASSSLAPHSPN
jgi:uncharacterized protein YxeA